MLLRGWVSQTLALSLVFALAGFTYALSTSVESDAPQVETRAVGSYNALRFTNPFVAGFTNEYDLGDALFGSVITRYVTADGGVRPYRFTSEGPNSFTNVIEGLQSSLRFSISGVLAGSVPSSLPNNPLYVTANGTPGLRFQVTVRDAQGTSGATRSGFFNLFLRNLGPNEYRFSIDSLPAGLLGSPYVARAETLGGVGKQVFSLVSVSGAASASELGIFVNSDGTISGRPLRTGTFTLTVRAVDSLNRTARNRQNSALDQALTFTVANSPVTSSDLITVSCSVKGDTAETNGDSLQYKGIVNVGGVKTLLNSPVFFRLGGIEISGVLDAKGRFKATLAGGEQVDVRVNTKGTIDAKVKKGTFGTSLNIAALLTPTDRRPVTLSIGDIVTTSEVLEFATEKSGTEYALNYSLGRTGSSSAGGFQITSIKGTDSVTQGGLEGDKWKVNFLALPRVGITANAGTNNVTLATISVGDNFVQQLKGIVSNGKNVRFSAGPDSGVKNFKVSSKSFKGSLMTNTLQTKQTGIPTAAKAAAFGQLYFPLGIELTRSSGESFIGEHGKAIFPSKKKYADVPPRR